jgi:hypothetical protein
MPAMDRPVGEVNKVDAECRILYRYAEWPDAGTTLSVSTYRTDSQNNNSKHGAQHNGYWMLSVTFFYRYAECRSTFRTTLAINLILRMV